MSKRGSDTQLTKDNYDQDSQDSNSQQMGTFKMASSDELARRPMKTLRRLGSKTLSNLSDDNKKVSPTTTSVWSTSSSSLSQSTLSSTSPFANVSFGETPAKSVSTSTTSPSLAQPLSGVEKGTSGSLKSAIKNQQGNTKAASTTDTSNSNTVPLVSLSSSILAKGAFTFNIGSNANTLAITSTTPAPTEPITIDREGYERSLRGLNQGFLKRIQRDLEHNATINLSGAFEAYIENRARVKKQYPGIEEPQTIILTPSSISDTVEVAPSKKTFSGIGLNMASGESTSSSGSTPAPPSSSPFANLAGNGLFVFGSSSIKGAIDPPRNPTAWNSSNNNSGLNGSITSSSPNPHFNSPFSTAAAGSPLMSQNTPFAITSTMTSSSNISSTPNKPFMFQPKPFTFGRQGSISSGTSLSTTSGSIGVAPKPFVFQMPNPWTPPVTTSNDTVSGSNVSTNGDQERVVDEAKSEMIDSRKGEEDEQTIYEVRAKLYATENNELKDLGVGQFRVNEHNVSKKHRMIMRAGGTGLITLNSWIIQGMTPQRNKTTLTIFAIENGKPRRFMLRVKEEHTAQELLEVLEACQTSTN
ncbi:hypothetical protein FBU30_001134 [Linnemannia zychae]|nr:hypothetical protein FBU30_001134 [Linnemannia zychae]